MKEKHTKNKKMWFEEGESVYESTQEKNRETKVISKTAKNSVKRRGTPPGG